MSMVPRRASLSGLFQVRRWLPTWRLLLQHLADGDGCPAPILLRSKAEKGLLFALAFRAYDEPDETQEPAEVFKAAAHGFAH